MTLHDLLVDYYVGGMSFMALARKHMDVVDSWVGRLLQKAEGIVAVCCNDLND